MRRTPVVTLVRGLVVLCGVSAPACGRHAPTTTANLAASPSATTTSLAVAPGQARRSTTALPKVTVAHSKFAAGSFPGDDGRDPTTEPVAATYELGDYAIDTSPYPGEAGAPPKTGVSLTEAESLCAARGGRLCNEIEWEHACRGPKGETFSTGNAWDPTCTRSDGANCVSDYGTHAMGTTLLEWTASVATTFKSDGRSSTGPVLRGAVASAPVSAHRCAARRLSEGRGPSSAIGFRCCYGPAPNLAMAPIVVAPTFRRAPLAPGKLDAVLAGAPELARVRSGARLFSETDARDVTANTHAHLDAWTLGTDPILWSPEPGAELLVLAGRGRGGSFVAAFWPQPDGSMRPATSLTFLNEKEPIVLGYQSNLRREIAWSMAWGSPGEGGAISYRDDHHAVVVQR
jgi:hypothetical protein